MATFHKFALSDSFPTVTVSEIHPSSVLCVFPCKSFERSPQALWSRGRLQQLRPRRVLTSYVSLPSPYLGMWLVLFNSWSIVQTRTGLNRHRRGYTIKEAASGVHSQDVGSYWARPVSIFKLSSSLSSPLFSSHNRYHHFKSYFTTGTIALSKAVVPNILVSSGYQGIWIYQS